MEVKVEMEGERAAVDLGRSPLPPEICGHPKRAQASREDAFFIILAPSYEHKFEPLDDFWALCPVIVASEGMYTAMGHAR